MKPKIKVAIVESERGWGSRIDEIKEFSTIKSAQKFVNKFNQKNVDDYAKTGTVPNWYMYAELV